MTFHKLHTYTYQVEPTGEHGSNEQRSLQSSVMAPFLIFSLLSCVFFLFLFLNFLSIKQHTTNLDRFSCEEKNLATHFSKLFHNKKSPGILGISPFFWILSAYLYQPAVFLARAQFTLCCDRTKIPRTGEKLFSENCIPGCALSASSFPKKNEPEFFFWKTKTKVWLLGLLPLNTTVTKQYEKRPDIYQRKRLYEILSWRP